MKTKELEAAYCVSHAIGLAHRSLTDEAILLKAVRQVARHEMQDAALDILASLSADAADASNADMRAAYDRAYAAIRELKTGVEK